MNLPTLPQSSIGSNLKRVCALSSVLFLSGCASLSLTAVNLFSLGFDGEVIKDVAYGDSEAQRSNIYIPEGINASSASLPVIIFFHGGSWRDGNKSSYKFVATTLASRGFIVVVPDYRKFPEVVFPFFIEDSAQAVAWVLDHIDQYGGDPANVFVSGHSSGAHMGALVLADESYLGKYQHQPQQIRGFVGLSGPYSFTPVAKDIVEVFGDLDDYSQMQVDSFVNGNEPPMLLLHGLDDQTVGTINIERLEAALVRENVEVTSRFYPDTGHANILGNFSAPLRAKSELLKDYIDFAISHLNE